VLEILKKKFKSKGREIRIKMKEKKGRK